MSTFSALGIGSGLDAEALVTQLMSLERQPIKQLDTKESSVKAKLSAFGTLRSALDSLKAASDVLGDANKLSAFKATASDTTVLSATSSGSASAGTYSLNVIRLATTEKQISLTDFASSSAAVGAGTLAITVGSTTTNVAVTSDTTTLAGMRDAINAAGAGVTANIINGDSGTKLVITANESGKNISISATDDNLGDGADFTQLSTFNLVGAAAQTAEVEIDGVTVTSTSNTLTTALGGVTLTLAKTGTASLTVARDSSTVKAAAENFVKAYNDFQTQAKTLTQFDPATNKGSTLTGDATVRNIQGQLYDAISQIPTGLSGAYTRLSDLGITVQTGGKLSLDSTKLQKSIDTDFSSVVSAFNGYGNALETKVGKLTETGGLMTGKTDSLNLFLKDISTRRNALEERMGAIEKRYRAQFTALDTMVASMKNTSTYLTQQLANLPG